MRARWLALGLAAILLLGVGLALGRRTAEPSASRPAVTVSEAAATVERHQSEREKPADVRPSGYPRTAEGAAAAATAYLGALGGRAAIDPPAVRAVLATIASADSRDELIRTYGLASAQARDQLGVADNGGSRVVLRTASLGYRIDGFHLGAATVSIWRVGIVGSQGTVGPRQSWRTETVSLVWEDETWKLDAVRSLPGPTPPLAGPSATPDAELFAAIPEFEEFPRELP